MSILIPIALLDKGSTRCVVAKGFKVVTYKWSVALIFAFISTILIKGLAYNTQTDWIYYYEHMHAAKLGVVYWWSLHTEYGYKMLVNFLAILRLPELSFFIVCTAFWYYALLKFSTLYQRAAPYIILLCFPFLFTGSLNIYRQYIAMSFLLLASFSYLNNKTIISLWLFVMAIFFHVVTILFPIVLFFIWICKRLRVSSYFLIAIVVVNTILGMSVLHSFVDGANLLVESVSSMNSHEYNLDALIEEEWTQSYVWLKLLLAIICIYLSDKIRYGNKYVSFLFYICAFFYIIRPFCQQLELSRISLIWGMFQPFLVGYMLYYNIKIKQTENITLLLLIVLFQYFSLFQSLDNISKEHPYIINLIY